MRIRPVGQQALLLEWDAPTTDVIEAWRAELERRRHLGELAAEEIVPAAQTILLDGLPDPGATAARLTDSSPPPPTAAASAADVVVPVRYDGPDLPEVAQHWQVDVAEVVARLSAIQFTVAFCGFAPGFGYLAGLPADWTVPRRATPRPAVPAGSVALAGKYAGIYPTASPGGWQLIGRTDLVLFDIDREPPATLAPGTRVRLKPLASPVVTR